MVIHGTKDGSGPIKAITLAEMQAMDAGYKWTSDDGETSPFRGQSITGPTLNEISTSFPDILMIIEIKQEEPFIVTDFYQRLRDFDPADKVLVGSSDTDTRENFLRPISR